MKFTSFTKRIASILIALVAGSSLPAQCAVLFHEDWSGYAAGDAASSRGHWIVSQGLPKQIAVVENPTTELNGKFVAPVYGTETDMVLLPGIRSASTFLLDPKGVSLTAQLAFATTSPSSQQYFRIGLESATTQYVNYWFEVFGNYVRVQKRTGNSAAVTIGERYNFDSSEWVSGQQGEFAFNITPNEEGGYFISLSLDGKELFAVEDAASVPDLSGAMRVLVDLRDPRMGYIGAISVHSIPEPGTVVFVGSGVVALCIGRRRFCKQSPASFL